MRDVDEADYYYLLHLFSEVSSSQEEAETVDAEDFFRTLLSPEDVAKLDERA